jgi:hypothetical protein
MTSPDPREYRPKYKLLTGLLSLVFGGYASMFYAAEALSERDYSGIADPQLRVGYCMASKTLNPEKYLLAETIARSPDLEMYMVVMPQVLGGVITEQKKAALLALRERDELRARASISSFQLADSCGFRDVAWSPGTTPLDINIKWLKNDATFLYFLEKLAAEPDAAVRFYNALGRSKGSTRADRF